MLSKQVKKIHCWGGLGSQFYAISLAIDLHSTYSNLELIFHNSGVTRRDLEAEDFVKSFFPYVTNNDFSKKLELSSDKVIVKTYSKRLISNLFFALNLLNHANTDEEFRKIRLWTYVIRGHYSYRTQNLATIKQMLERFMFFYGQLIQKSSIVVHYRLDDIIKIDGKTVISSERVIEGIKKSNCSGTIRIYSDSAKELQNRFEGKFQNKYEVSDLSTEHLVVNAISAECFVGTVSKVSFWIVFFRLANNTNSINLMPIESRPHLVTALVNLRPYKNLIFY